MERGALAAMGTRFEIIVAGESASHARAAIESALAEIEHCHHLWNPFSGDSVVARLHDTSRTEVPVDGLTLELIELCDRLQRETDGAFSATVGSVLASRDPRRSSQKEWTGNTGSSPLTDTSFKIHRQPPHVQILATDLRWDFGAIAKGFALDLAVEVLRESGVENAFLHGGASSVTVMGSAPGLKGWRVQLPHGKVVTLTDGESLAVSSGLGNYDGSHLVDPVSGEWIEGMALGCWVRGNCSAEVDAWATALLVSTRRPVTLEIAGTEETDWGIFEIPEREEFGEELNPVECIGLRDSEAPLRNAGSA